MVFGGTVSASFGYGLLLLARAPLRSPGDARPASLPPDVLALLERSAEQLRKREVEQALLGYRRVLTLGPSLPAQLGLAEGEWLAGRDAEAVREYQRVLRLDPVNQTALLRLARMHTGRRESWGLAESYYLQYLGLAPGDAQARLELARLLSWRGRVEAAADAYGRPEVQELLGPEDRRNYALALVRIGRGEEVEAVLAGISRSDPTDVDATLSLAGLHASRREWDRALPLYRAALARRPDDPRANLTYGQGLLAQGDHRRALAPLSKAAGLLPADPEAGLAHARALRGVGDLKRADKEFERVLALLDGQPAVEREYGDLLVTRKSYTKAADYYRRALSHGLKDERLLAGLAGALNAGGKPREALPYLEEAYALGRSGRLGLELAQLYRRLGRADRALELLAEIERARAPH